jgi:YVTN family beta-propeller protein
MSVKKIFPLIFLLIIIFGCAGSNSRNYTSSDITLPGEYNGYTLLPNGWKLTPAGRKAEVDGFPLNLILTKDGKYAITSNSPAKDNSVSVVNIKEGKEIQRVLLRETWRGIVFNGDDSKLFASGGNKNLIYIFNFSNGKLTLADSIIIGEPYPKEEISIAGLDFLPSRNLLFAVSRMSNSLYIIDMNKKEVIKTLRFEGQCYDVKINHAGTYAYVSIWGKASIAEIDLSNFAITNIIDVGDHPCEILISKDDSRLYVANANNNTVSVVNLITKKEVERINSALRPNAPYGSTPNAVCFTHNDSVLVIANADNNYLALFDVSDTSKAQPMGFIPVGWYPTSVKALPNNEIIAANGMGFTSYPNPLGPVPIAGGRSDWKSSQYISFLMKGTLSIINYPDRKQLDDYTSEVFSNTPYVQPHKYNDEQHVVPADFDSVGSSKIKHVFYIIKENRTYDQVLGDLGGGNGDTSLCIFGEKITPNIHKLVKYYTLYDNFYCNAQVSPDGHNWSTAAYATDYVEKTVPEYAGWRGQPYNYGDWGGISNLVIPSSGYIWDQAVTKNIGVRDYGEFVIGVKGVQGLYAPTIENMDQFASKTYPGFDLSISDVKRYEIWAKEFEKYEEEDSLPAFTIMRLPNDHTEGTKKGALTPQAYLAQNDYALGLIVDKISKSKFWKQTAIFVLEDDAQNGSDHVDCHRSELLVISPYIKRHFVDHTLYTTCSVLKTIELILGLKPMTQYDLSAAPILNSFTDIPDFHPYDAVQPLINIEEKNLASAYGAKESAEFDFSKEDRAPDVELNEIIWKSIKGKDSKMPPPVTSAFVRVVGKNEGDD